MSNFILTLGSNTSDRTDRVAAGIEWLESQFQVKAATDVYSSPDASNSARAPYANAIVVVSSDYTAEEMNRSLKEYERICGRVRPSSDVPIDIDAVICDDTLLRPRDYCAPYFIKGLYLLRCR